MEATNPAIHYGPLENAVTRAEVREFKSRYPGMGGSFSTASAATGGVIALAVIVLVLAQTGSMLLSSASGLDLDTLLPGVFLFVILSLVAVVVIRSILQWGGRWEKWMRLSRFAEANGMEYRPSIPNPWYTGVIFGRGSARSAYDSIMRTGDRAVHIGNFRYTTGSGKNRTTHHWGFMSLALDRALPHMMLDSTANNGLFGTTNLPTSFRRDQALSLEGDFDKYFTLYCPREYERDALYVFTPDLMALLIDEAAPFDVEIVDEWMFVYSSKPFDPLSRLNYERLFRIVRTVGAKTLSQTDRYRDERVGSFEANMVAPQGRRLKSGVPVVAVVVMVAFAVFWLWGMIGDGLVG